jgi:hypothetical protein
MASTPFRFAPPPKLLWPAPMTSPGRRRRRFLKNNSERQRLWQEIVGFLSRAPARLASRFGRIADSAILARLRPTSAHYRRRDDLWTIPKADVRSAVGTASTNRKATAMTISDLIVSIAFITTCPKTATWEQGERTKVDVRRVLDRMYAFQVPLERLRYRAVRLIAMTAVSYRP